MRLLFLLFFLVCGHASAASDVELARQAREALSQKDYKIGFVEKLKCFSSKILKGKTLKQTRTECRKDLQSLNMVLAIYSEGDTQFTFVTVSGTGPDLCASKTPGFETKCYLNILGEINGLNTEFVITYPKGYKVYAINGIVNLNNPRVAVYTPYGDALNTPDVRLAGKEYVRSVIDRAAYELRARGVRSRSNPNVLVADLMERKVFEWLAIIEHIDVNRYLYRSARFQDLVEEVCTIYGLNQENAYGLSKSSANAHSMFQIIPSTYQMIAGKYPEANLNKDFASGVSDHVNAAMVAILLADYNVSLIPKETRGALLADRRLGEFIASSYNGAPSRPVRIWKARKDFVRHNDNNENRQYVLKMRTMSTLNF